MGKLAIDAVAPARWIISLREIAAGDASVAGESSGSPGECCSDMRLLMTVSLRSVSVIVG